jgi:peptide-methionine (S)-S-oxide reductase
VRAAAALAAVLVAAAAAPAPAAERGEALFAGGCFWCMETAFEGKPGVKAVISGYAGGTVAHPSYDQVSTGTTGHAETVRVLFDPAKITYKQLLAIYWHNIDPFSADGQFCDRGSQYRPVIFVLDDSQRRQAEESKRAAAKELGKPVVADIVRAGPFWPAEEYHQDFYLKDSEHYERYRQGCGRDRRLHEVWGDQAPAPPHH